VRLWAALAGLTALRLLVAWSAPMAPDEAYYWVWSHALAPGFLDHPPMVALCIRLGTFLAGEGNLGVRLLSPIFAALGTVMLAKAGDDLFPGRKMGIRAAILLNATLLFAAGGTTMTPDTPLLLFWTATLWALARLRATGDGRWWLVAGLMAGLALDSKYTAVLLAPAILAWLIVSPEMRPWLRRAQPYVAAALAALIFAPVFAWNAAHSWASFAKQGGRTADWSPNRALQFIGELFAGQIGLATPLIAVLAGAGLVLAIRRARRGDASWALLACLTGVPMLVFLQHALGDRVQANWPAIVYPSAMLAAAALAGWGRRLFAPAAVLGFAMSALVWVQACLAPLPLPVTLDPTLLRLGGWDSLAAGIDAAATAEGATFIAADNYGHAALLARLLPPGRVVLGVEQRWALFDLPHPDAALAGRTGLLVRSARRDDMPEPGFWSSLVRLPKLSRARDGMVAEEFRLYRVVLAPDAANLAVMPRPRTQDDPAHER
jgi:4-amino-4-deoxy-L-arabinose transferase-like glycosyltransferase